MDRHLSPAETARLFGISVKALRLYEQRGLLMPLRSESGWRVYGPDRIGRLHQILALKHLGLSLARIGEILNGPDRLETVLALQEQVLARESERLSRALKLVRAARSKLASGNALSIDDLANLNKETTMASRLTRKTFFHPALAAHQRKYFTVQEIAGFGSRPDLDQERDIADWTALIAELKTLAAAGDPASPAALDLGRRWNAHGEKLTRGDKSLRDKLRNMAKDALADPKTAANLPFTAQDVAFLSRIMAQLAKPGEATA
jgi:DNA-binding transcriptional MerR regulator